MKVEIGEYTYFVSFHHSADGKKTTCLISQGLPNIYIAIGGVSRFYLDPPNRVVARKKALAKALVDGGFSKPDRQLFWDRYAETHRLTSRVKAQALNRETEKSNG